jgi:uncharacterized damage-inducible protein DinB
MSLKIVSTSILDQLAGVVAQLSDEEYARPLPVLSGNTIGRHVRHVLEFYELLVESTRTQRLDYDRRQRDPRLEMDTEEVLRRIALLNQAVQQLDLPRSLSLTANLSEGGTGCLAIPTTVARELLYNTEHAIHHMALIQVALRNTFPGIVLPPHFGVAASTVRHQSQQ